MPATHQQIVSMPCLMPGSENRTNVAQSNVSRQPSGNPYQMILPNRPYQFSLPLQTLNGDAQQLAAHLRIGQPGGPRIPTMGPRMIAAQNPSNNSSQLIHPRNNHSSSSRMQITKPVSSQQCHALPYSSRKSKQPNGISRRRASNDLPTTNAGSALYTESMNNTFTNNRSHGIPSTSSGIRQEWVPTSRNVVRDAGQDNMTTSCRPPPAPPPSAANERASSSASGVAPIEPLPTYPPARLQDTREWISLDEAVVLYSSLGVVPKFDEFISSCETARSQKIPFWCSRTVFQHPSSEVHPPYPKLQPEESPTNVALCRNSPSHSQSLGSAIANPLTPSGNESSLTSSIVLVGGVPSLPNPSKDSSRNSENVPSRQMHFTSIGSQNPILNCLLGPVASPQSSQDILPSLETSVISPAVKPTSSNSPSDSTVSVKPESLISASLGVNKPTLRISDHPVICTVPPVEIICLDSPSSLDEDMDLDKSPQGSKEVSGPQAIPDSVENAGLGNDVPISLSAGRVMPSGKDSLKPHEEMRILDGKAYPVLDSNDIIVPVPVLVPHTSVTCSLMSSSEISVTKIFKEADSSLSSDTIKDKKSKKRKTDHDKHKSKRRKHEKVKIGKDGTETNLKVQHPVTDNPVLAKNAELGDFVKKSPAVTLIKKPANNLLIKESTNSATIQKSPDSTSIPALPDSSSTHKSPDSTSDSCKVSAEIDCQSEKIQSNVRQERTGVTIKKREDILTCKPFEDSCGSKTKSSKKSTAVPRTIREFDMFASTDKEQAKFKEIKDKKKRRKQLDQVLLKKFVTVKKCSIKIERVKKFDEMALRLARKKKHSSSTQRRKQVSKKSTFSSPVYKITKSSKPYRVKLIEVNTNVNSNVFSPKKVKDLMNEKKDTPLSDSSKPDSGSKHIVDNSVIKNCDWMNDSSLNHSNQSSPKNDLICVLSSPRTLIERDEDEILSKEFQADTQDEENVTGSAMVVAPDPVAVKSPSIVENRNVDNDKSISNEKPSIQISITSEYGNFESESSLENPNKRSNSEQLSNSSPSCPKESCAKTVPHRMPITGRHTGLPVVTAASKPIRSGIRPSPLSLKFAPRISTVTATTSTSPESEPQTVENVTDSNIASAVTADDKKHSAQRDARLKNFTYCGISRDMLRQRRPSADAVDATVAFLREVDLKTPSFEAYDCSSCKGSFELFSEWQNHSCLNYSVPTGIKDVAISSEMSALVKSNFQTSFPNNSPAKVGLKVSVTATDQSSVVESNNNTLEFSVRPSLSPTKGTSSSTSLIAQLSPSVSISSIPLPVTSIPLPPRP